jgi:hypothetical protein
MDVPELGQSAARARQAAPDADGEAPLPPAPEVIHAETAFIVYRLPDGQVILNADLNAPVTVRRPPLSHDVVGMAHCVIEYIRLMGLAPATAKAVVDAVEAKQQEQLKQMQDAHIVAQMQRRGGG